MFLRNPIFFIVFVGCYAVCAWAQAGLSALQMNRLAHAKELLGAVDTRAVEMIAAEIAKSPAAEGALQIFEAVARVYADLVDEYELTDYEARERLLERIRMNMAYFQLGGPDAEGPGESGLNVLIRRRLIRHLPPELMSDPRLFHSLEK